MGCNKYRRIPQKQIFLWLFVAFPWKYEKYLNFILNESTFDNAFHILQNRCKVLDNPLHCFPKILRIYCCVFYAQVEVITTSEKLIVCYLVCMYVYVYIQGLIIFISSSGFNFSHVYHSWPSQRWNLTLVKLLLGRAKSLRLCGNSDEHINISILACLLLVNSPGNPLRYSHCSLFNSVSSRDLHLQTVSAPSVKGLVHLLWSDESLCQWIHRAFLWVCCFLNWLWKMETLSIPSLTQCFMQTWSLFSCRWGNSMWST